MRINQIIKEVAPEHKGLEPTPENLHKILDYYHIPKEQRINVEYGSVLLPQPPGNPEVSKLLADLEDKKFPILSSEINFQKKVIRLQGETINEIIQDAKDKGLSYLAVTSAGQNDNQILSKIYHEEYNYPYLKKIYDSKNYGFKFNIKIFEINYNEFELT